MKKIKFGVIGLGHRGKGLLKVILMNMPTVEVTAVCDLYEDRVQEGIDIVKKATGNAAYGTTDAHELINRPDVEAVFIYSAWESHIPLAIECMKASKPVGVEVGGAYSVEQCWELVHTYEKTGTPIMLLENCCYDRRELMVLNMVRQGLFGEIVHCEGGYCHDLRDEISEGEQNRHYRLRNYLARNCENYPTHELGPIAKVLNINRGNRFVKLASFASKSAGLNEYINANMPENEKLKNAHFAQGDVVTTVITCAGGQTIRLTLDTTLPRYYSRQFTVRGTKGMYEEVTDSVYLDGDGKHFKWKEEWGNGKTYAEKYDHEIWKKYLSDGVQGGHGGIDWLVMNDFVDSLIENRPCPIDVYDMASWMCVSALSENSIALGGAPVDFPDFTNGAWLLNKI